MVIFNSLIENRRQKKLCWGRTRMWSQHPKVRFYLNTFSAHFISNINFLHFHITLLFCISKVGHINLYLKVVLEVILTCRSVFPKFEPKLRRKRYVLVGRKYSIVVRVEGLELETDHGDGKGARLLN